MIDTDKYEGHTLHKLIQMDEPSPETDEWDGHKSREMICDGGIVGWLIMGKYPSADVNAKLITDAPLLLEEVERLRDVINKAMQQHTVLRMRGELFESCCIDAEGQYESGHWEREEE